MTDPDMFADEVFGFHAQQAVEKSLKAWLSLIDVEVPQVLDEEAGRRSGLTRNVGGKRKRPRR